MNGQKSTRLLIVDDEETQMQALCETLAAHGYETHGHTSGRDALAALQVSRFDLLLADLNMPGIDGISLVRAALALDPFLIGVVMTEPGSIATALEAMQSGALDYILKPLKLNEALPVLSRALTVRALRVQNAALEEKVRSRMQDLAIANIELDALSHAISHDLRAPLQAVEGFSAILASEHTGQLDQKGLHYVSRIRAGIGRLSDLIDGLMSLSRLSRQPLERRTVDVRKLVEAVLDNLRNDQILLDDRVSVEGQLPVAIADPPLSRELYVNLLSNACKFTAGREQPHVQVGFRLDGAECIYFVRDNGAGFDMAYAAKLFGPFQRMHRSDQFAGLGLGLAIAQRIVLRHGGRIWAEAEVGNGATFYFSLP